MSKIKINNTAVLGKNIDLSANKIIIDGIDYTPDSKSVNIVVVGNLDSLTL